MSEEGPVRFFIAKHLSLRGREVTVTAFLLDLVIWLWFWVDRWQAMFNRKFDNSLDQLDKLVDDPPKTEVKVGRGVQENTRQYRKAKETNVICLVFLTNI